MHVARAFTWPKLAGMFGSTHDPSAFTGTVRFKTLTVQFWFSCARADKEKTKLRKRMAYARFPRQTPKAARVRARELRRSAASCIPITLPPGNAILVSRNRHERPASGIAARDDRRVL